ncbi:MAG: hypothetical protein ACLVJ6_00690 [Merdibacter sp.]
MTDTPQRYVQRRSGNAPYPETKQRSIAASIGFGHRSKRVIHTGSSAAPTLCRCDPSGRDEAGGLKELFAQIGGSFAQRRRSAMETTMRR